MLIKNTNYLDENLNYVEGFDIRVEGDTFASITNYQESENAAVDMDGESSIDGSKFIMMPAFYNAHGHSTMTLMRGYGENLNLQDWLFKKIFPFEDLLTPEAVYYGTLLSMAESFKYGIASTSDMYYHLDYIVDAVKASGAKTNVSRAMANPTGMPFDELPSVKEMIDYVSKYNGIENGRVIIDSSLHAEYTSNEDTARRLAELTKELGLRMHVHVSETKTEHDECKERHEGRTPTKYLADAGLFDVPSYAAHCVWIEDEDIDILLEKGVTVVTNPVSNLKLASGICDVNKLLKRGVKVALGTDSVASNNNLSMFEEMKTMMLLAKVKNMDPTVISPKEALHLATRAGALTQGREDCGVIKEGAKADYILLKKDSPNLHPIYDIVSNVVLSATDSDIYMTVVDGQIVYRDGEFLTIDIEDTIQGVNRAIKDITSRL